MGLKAKYKELLGALLMIVGIAFCFGIRIIDIDLTEGQSLTLHWHIFLAATVLIIGGYLLIRSAGRDLP